MFRRVFISIRPSESLFFLSVQSTPDDVHLSVVGRL